MPEPLVLAWFDLVAKLQAIALDESTDASVLIQTASNQHSLVAERKHLPGKLERLCFCRRVKEAK